LSPSTLENQMNVYNCLC